MCFRKDIDNKKFTFPTKSKLEKHVIDFLEENPDVTIYNEKKYPIIYNGKLDNEFSNKMIRLGIVNKGGQGERIYSIKGIAATLSAYGGGVFAKTGGYLVNGIVRRLSPRECARIMGYPDTYKITNNKTEAYKQFGNSVVIDVLQYIVLEITKTIE